MKGWDCHWVWTSFGLPPEYKLGLHEEIFNLCYHSNGGFTHGEIYHMPIYLRRFYIKKLVDVKKQESAQYESASKNTKSPSKISRPGGLSR
jgi:hypothetical protein